MTTSEPNKRNWLTPAAWLLAVATLILYLPILRYEFVNFDDQDYVTDNSEVKNGLTWQGFRWAFTTFHAANWHPLTWLSHMLDCQLFGLNPGAHHFVNVLWHAANAALLLVLLVRMTGRFWPGLLVAALFAWHPLHVESVAWISERKDVLSTFFAFLTLLAYVHFTRTGSRWSYGLALVYFTLSLLAKPMQVTLPCVMLLLDFWPLQRFSLATFSRRQCLRIASEKIPFFLLAAVSCVMTNMAQRYAEMGLGWLPLDLRVDNALTAYARYLLNTVWPVNLAILYPLPRHAHWLHVAAAASASVLLLLSWFAWREQKHRPYITIGWLWFLGTLVPVIGLVKVGNMALADRYTYFPLIGIFIVVAFGADEIATRFPFLKKSIVAAAVLALAGCIALTEHQLPFWRNSETLFGHAVAVTSENVDATVNFGAALETAGHAAEAATQYRAAIGMASNSLSAHINLAHVLLAMGQKREALAEYRTAISMDPDNGSFHYGLGFALESMGQWDAATNELASAIRLDPKNPWPHFEMAKIFLQTGHDAAAVDALHAALQLDPDNYQILTFTAQVLAADVDAGTRNGRDALTMAIKANVLTDSSQPMVFDVLGMALAENGDFTNAQACAQNALTLANAAGLQGTDPIRQRLQMYQQHQPWRESFRATNAPVK